MKRMSKERLYEIFSKVNKLSLNEEINDEFKDVIIDDIKVHFKYDSGDKAFWNGIPMEMLVRIQNNDIQFDMLKEEGLQIKREFPEQIQYHAIYTGDLEKVNERFADIVVKLFVPVTVNVEKEYIENRINFNTEIWIESEKIDIEFNRR